MKLHLPKLLCVAVMAAMALPAMGGTLTNIASEGAKAQWNVGGGDQSMRPADNVVSHTGDITLNDGDQLGYFKDGSMVTYDNGDGVTMHLVTNRQQHVDENGKKTYTTLGTETQYIQGNKEFSNILDLTGTLYINGTASVQLGGQYKLQKRTDTYDEDNNLITTGSATSYKDDYSGLRADNVIVSGTGNGTHLHSTSALIGNLTVKSGKVTLHTDQYNGNGTWQSFYNDGTSFKVAQIENSLTQEGGSITMGRTKSDHKNTTTSHINNVFGTKDTAATINQINGSLEVIGYSYARTGMTISQQNGSMKFRDVLLFYSAGDNTIQQTGNGTMVFGRLDSSSSRVNFDVIQSGDGTIKFTGGTNLGRAKVNGVYENSLLNITQSGNGKIEIGGGNGITAANYPIKNFGNKYTTYNIDQTGTGIITVKSDATITANTVNVGKDATLNVDGTMTVDGTSTLSGTVNVAENASFTLNGETTVKGNSSLLGNVTINADVIFEVTANVSVSSTLSMSVGHNMTFNIGSVEQDHASMTMTETGNLAILGGTITLELSDVAIQEMAAGATYDGTEYHVTLIDNLSAADVGELESILNTDLSLESYELTVPVTLAAAITDPVTITSDTLVIEDNALKAVVLSTKNIPEPTTATLSLLALAGLAARRRRASR